MRIPLAGYSSDWNSRIATVQWFIRQQNFVQSASPLSSSLENHVWDLREKFDISEMEPAAESSPTQQKSVSLSVFFFYKTQQHTLCVSERHNWIDFL